MQILDQKYPRQALSAGLCCQAGCLGSAVVEPNLWEKIEFENEGGGVIGWGIEWIRLWNAWT